MKKLLFIFSFAICFVFLYKVDSFAYDDSFVPIAQYQNTSNTSTITVFVIDNDFDDMFVRVDSDTNSLFFYRWNGVAYNPVNFIYCHSSLSDTDFSIYGFQINYYSGSTPSIFCSYGSNVPNEKVEVEVIDEGLGSDIYVSHTEFKFLNYYSEYFTIRKAFNYLTSIDHYEVGVFVNAELKRSYTLSGSLFDRIGWSDSFSASSVDALVGDNIEYIVRPVGKNGSKGLWRGVLFTVGSGTNSEITKIPYTKTTVSTPIGKAEPEIQQSQRVIYSKSGDKIINNYYEESYYFNENYDQELHDKVDDLYEWLLDHEVSGSSPTVINNYNTTNKNYNFEFNIDTDIDVDSEIGNAKDKVNISFSEFLTFLSPLIDSPFGFLVELVAAAFGIIIIVLGIVIVSKILDIVIP